MKVHTEHTYGTQMHLFVRIRAEMTCARTRHCALASTVCARSGEGHKGIKRDRGTGMFTGVYGIAKPIKKDEVTHTTFAVKVLLTFSPDSPVSFTTSHRLSRRHVDLPLSVETAQLSHTSSFRLPP